MYQLETNLTVVAFAAGRLGSVPHIQQEGHDGEATAGNQRAENELFRNGGQEAGESDNWRSHVSNTSSPGSDADDGGG